MTLIQRLKFRWNQPANEGIRLIIAMVLNLAGITGSLWVIWQCVSILIG